jgi:hypothetical protein
MRRRLAFIALAVAGLLATPVVSAAPAGSSWESGTGRIFDECAGEYVDNTFTAHFVETGSGLFHFNVQIAGTGETSGSSYIGGNEDNEYFHASPDGTFTFDQVLNIRLVGEGKLGNSWVAVRIHVILDADGNVISGRGDVSFRCQSR